MIPINVKPSRCDVISILCPSRKRPEMLPASIASLRDRAARPDLLEVLVAYDPDDAETAATAAEIHADVITCAPERYGHAGCARYFAILLNEATGEWVIPWNDDAFMETDGWDDIVRSHPGGVLDVRSNAPGNCFPIIHADVFRRLGRFTEHPAIDTWYDDVARAAGMLHEGTGLYVRQERPDLTGCKADETWSDAQGNYHGGLNYYGDDQQALRWEDAALLVEGS